MSVIKCGICGSKGASLDDFDNLFCGTCKATGSRGLDGADYWEPDESWTGDELDGHHGIDKNQEGDGDGGSEGREDDEEVEGEDEGEGRESESEGDGEPDDGQTDDDFEIVFEARDYQHESEGQDGFPDPVSIVVDSVGKLLPAIRWLRDITSLRDGKPIGLDEAREAITAVAKDNKRIEVKDVPQQSSNIVLTAATFANVVAREFTPPTPEEQEKAEKEKEKNNEAA